MASVKVLLCMTVLVCAVLLPLASSHFRFIRRVFRKRPSGPSGPRGHTGPRGHAGPPGRTGPQGSRGFPGVSGLLGFPGVAGTKGLTGDQGPVGAKGESGILQNLKCSFSQSVGARHACPDLEQVATSCSCYPSCTSWHLVDSRTCLCQCKVNATMEIEGYFKTGAICCKLETKSLSAL